MAGEHYDAISRIDDLIATVPFNSICHVVQARAHVLPRGEYHHSHFQQAYMYLLLGNSHMEHSDYEGAVRSLERAQAPVRNCVGPRLFVISLVSFPNGYIATYRIEFTPDSDRYPDGILMISIL